MARDQTSIARTTKRIGSLRYFIRHRGTSKKNFGTAPKKQMEAWERQLEEELKLREELKRSGPPTGSPRIRSLSRATTQRSFPVVAGDGALRAQLGSQSVVDLLALSRAILAELRQRGVIRSGNAPAGDYAELLVQRATDGELAPASQKSWDILAANGERLQVKARVLTDPRIAGERQLSVFRSWDFDAALIVLFDDDFRVWRAARIPVGVLQDGSRFMKHVSGYRVLATDAFLEIGDDWTERLRAVEG